MPSNINALLIIGKIAHGKTGTSAQWIYPVLQSGQEFRDILVEMTFSN